MVGGEPGGQGKSPAPMNQRPISALINSRQVPFQNDFLSTFAVATAPLGKKSCTVPHERLKNLSRSLVEIFIPYPVDPFVHAFAMIIVRSSSSPLAVRVEGT